MVTWVKTKFKGVRYWESEVKDISGKTLNQGNKKPRSWKPDRCFVIRYQKHGKTVAETLGWQSNGMSDQLANNERGRIITNIKTGEEGSHQSLKEKQALEKERREKKEAKEIAEALENVPFHVLGDRYIEWAKDEKPASYKGDESRYRNHLKTLIGDIPVKDMSTIALERFKKELSKKKGRGGKPLTPKTVQHCLTLVRQMYNKASGWEIYYGPNPVTETAKTHKKFLSIPDNRRLRFLSRSEADKLLTYLTDGAPDKKGRVVGANHQLRDMAILGIYAGLRASEIFSLSWRDIDLTHGNINIKDPKNGTSRSAYITTPIRKMLDRRKDEGCIKSSLVFKSRTGEKIREVSNSFDRAIEKLNLNKDVSDSRDRVVFHTTRHTFASWAAMAGTHLATLKELMGHKTIEMTLRYAHLCPDHGREEAERMVQGVPRNIVELRKTKAKKK